jgi:hypothetical protein
VLSRLLKLALRNGWLRSTRFAKWLPWQRHFAVRTKPHFARENLTASGLASAVSGVHRHGNQFECRNRLRHSIICYLGLRTRANFLRSAVSGIPTPMAMRASVALRPAGAMQSMQVPMIDGASYTGRPSFDRNPLYPHRWLWTSRESIHCRSRGRLHDDPCNSRYRKLPGACFAGAKGFDTGTKS